MNKKTLIISSYIPPSIGGGPQMLGNLLRNLPDKSYHILTSFSNINHEPTKTNDWLSGKYSFYDKPKKNKRDLSPNNNISKINALFIVRLINYLVGWLKTIRNSFLIFISGKEIITNEKIECIIATSDYGPSLISAYFLHKKTKKELILILFDIYKGNSLSFGNNFLALFFEPKIIKSANKIIVNNERTRDLYIKRYDSNIENKIHVIHNSAFPEQYSQLNYIKKQRDFYTIVFTGSVYWPQIQSLKNLIEAVSKLDDIKIKIYTPTSVQYLKNVGIEKSNKVEIDLVSPDEIPKIQSQADILFLPLSWNSRSQDIINTATPGKLTDYLIANRPILIHAPSSSFLVKYAKENNFAHIVDSEDIEQLKEGVIKIITDTNYSNNLVKNAKETFFKNHDANKNSQRFRKLIDS